MNDDLVRRLRKQSSAGRANHVSKADRLAAADRIEALEAELATADALTEKLEKAVRALKAAEEYMAFRSSETCQPFPLERIRATLIQIAGDKTDDHTD